MGDPGPSPCGGSDLRLTDLNQLLVSGFPHLYGSRDSACPWVSSDLLGTSPANTWRWHLFTPTALESFWHGEGPSLATTETADVWERVKKRSRSRQDWMGQKRTGVEEKEKGKRE